MNKPFRILGIQQVAIGGADKMRLRSLWVDIFGLAVKSTFVSERENVDEDICALGLGPAILPREAVQTIGSSQGLVLVPLTDAWAERQFVICLRADGSVSATTRMLVEALRAAAQADTQT